MNFSRWQRLRWLVIPASLPGWFTGLRLALSQAWVSLIVVELLASSEGIGYLMVWGRQLFQLDIVFVTIAVVGLSGLLMEWATNRVYARLVFWPQPATGRLAWKPQASWHAFQLPLILLALWQLASGWGWIEHVILLAAGGGAALYGRSGQRRAARRDAGQSRTGLCRRRAGDRYRAAVRVAAGPAPASRADIDPDAERPAPYRALCWLPLLTAWVGNDNGGKIVFIALASFRCFSTLRAVSQRDPQLDEVAKVLRFGPLTRLRTLILPGRRRAYCRSAPGVDLCVAGQHRRGIFYVLRGRYRQPDDQRPAAAGYADHSLRHGADWYHRRRAG